MARLELALLGGFHAALDGTPISGFDSDKTRVYSRQPGLLVPVDPNLETQARQQAEHQLQESALQDGILKNAQQNVRTTLTGLLTGLGFEKVEFD